MENTKSIISLCFMGSLLALSSFALAYDVPEKANPKTNKEDLEVHVAEHRGLSRNNINQPAASTTTPQTSEKANKAKLAPMESTPPTGNGL